MKRSELDITADYTQMWMSRHDLHMGCTKTRLLLVLVQDKRRKNKSLRHAGSPRNATPQKLHSRKDIKVKRTQHNR